MRRVFCFFALLSYLLSPVAFAQGGGTRLLRFPDIHGDTIAFSYAGDLWMVGTDGGAARRLTSDRRPRAVPEALAGRQVDRLHRPVQRHQSGARDRRGGGTPPKQLTFRNDVGQLPPRGGFDNQVLGWTPDGKEVLFKSNRTPWSERVGRRYYLVPVAGGIEHAAPMPESAIGTLSPDGTKMVYTPIDREFRTWKRTKGGRAQDVWIYDFAAKKSRSGSRPGRGPTTSRCGGATRSTSLRTARRTLNLFALRPEDEGDPEGHVLHRVRRPLAERRRRPDRLMNGGYLYQLDRIGPDGRDPDHARLRLRRHRPRLPRRLRRRRRGALPERRARRPRRPRRRLHVPARRGRSAT